MKSKKSAKDMAFEKERAKFRKQIRALEDVIASRDKQILELCKTIEQREAELFKEYELNAQLIARTGLTPEEFKELLNAEKQKAEIVSHLAIMQNLIPRSY